MPRCTFLTRVTIHRQLYWSCLVTKQWILDVCTSWCQELQLCFYWEEETAAVAKVIGKLNKWHLSFRGKSNHTKTFSCWVVYNCVYCAFSLSTALLEIIDQIYMYSGLKKGLLEPNTPFPKILGLPRCSTGRSARHPERRL